MKKLKNATLLLSALGCMTLASCGGGKGGTTAAPKIGVLVADVSGEEAQAFRTYMTEYVAKQYGATIEYTTALENAADEKSAIEDFAGRGFDAIISMSSSDRAAQLATCVQNKIYYTVGSGMLDDKVYETYKGNEYFLGQIGPSMQTEYEAGLAMGQYYKAKGVDHVGMYGAFIPNPMHVFRAAGVIVGLGDTYGEASEMGAIVGQIYADNGIQQAKIGGDVTVDYMAGFDPTTTYSTLGSIIGSGIDAFLSVGMATTFFSQNLNDAKIPYGDIDAFTSSNGTNMSSGSLNYLAGKYASSLGPVYALIANAKNGHSIRDAQDNAPSISQSYAVATSSEEFTALAAKESGDTRIFSKEVLDSMIGDSVTYDAFVEAVQKERI